MHHAESHELGLLQPGNHSKHARLLTPLELCLETHEAVVIAREVVLAELHRGIRRTACTRIHQPDRLHRPETQRIDAAMRHHFDRQAPFEELLVVEIMDGRRLGVNERVVELLVLLPRQRAVQVVALAVIDRACRRSERPPARRLP